MLNFCLIIVTYTGSTNEKVEVGTGWKHGLTEIMFECFRNIAQFRNGIVIVNNLALKYFTDGEGS